MAQPSAGRRLLTFISEIEGVRSFLAWVASNKVVSGVSTGLAAGIWGLLDRLPGSIIAVLALTSFAAVVSVIRNLAPAPGVGGEAAATPDSPQADLLGANATYFLWLARDDLGGPNDTVKAVSVSSSARADLRRLDQGYAELR